jgi:hypothetical protein
MAKKSPKPKSAIALLTANAAEKEANCKVT